MGQINQENRLEYWATRLSVCSFTRTAHSFACSALVASLARSAALARSWDSVLLDGYLFCVFFSILAHKALRTRFDTKLDRKKFPNALCVNTVSTIDCIFLFILLNSNPKYEVATYDFQPGDICVFHMKTLHAAHANLKETQRRVLSLRCVYCVCMCAHVCAT